MKKSFILSALILVGIVFSAVARENPDYRYPYQAAKVSYRNVPVLKVLDHKDVYIVMYSKPHSKIGSVTVPKSWYSSGKSVPSKLAFRQLPAGMAPYMTVVSKEGAFDRVILTVPVSRLDEVWGVASSNIQVNDADKESLELQ